MACAHPSQHNLDAAAAPAAAFRHQQRHMLTHQPDCWDFSSHWSSSHSTNWPAGCEQSVYCSQPLELMCMIWAQHKLKPAHNTGPALLQCSGSVCRAAQVRAADLSLVFLSKVYSVQAQGNFLSPVFPPFLMFLYLRRGIVWTQSRPQSPIDMA